MLSNTSSDDPSRNSRTSISTRGSRGGCRAFATTGGLGATDGIFANPSTVYATNDNLRGFELSPNQDQFSISPDLLTLSSTATTWANVDDLRIITAEQSISGTVSQLPTPEPGTFLLVGLALVGVGWFRKGKKSRSDAR